MRRRAAIEKPEIVAPPAFAVYAKRPSVVTTSQHGAPWCVATAPLITCAPDASIAYDDAEPAASETNARPRPSNAKPNGVAPADGLETPGCATPPLTAKVSSVLVPFSVTTSCEPSARTRPAPGPCRAAAGSSRRSTRRCPLPSILKPVIVRRAGVERRRAGLVHGDADRADAVRRERRLEPEPVVLDGELGDRVAAGVDGEQQCLPLSDERDRALRAEARAGAEPAGRDTCRRA